MLSVLAMTLTLVGMEIPGFKTVNDFIGVEINESTSQLISSDIESTSFWDKLFKENFGIFAIIIASTLAIGFFARGYDTSLVILPFIILVAGIYISMFWGIISYVKVLGEGWLTSIIAIIFTGLGAGYAMACVDYFGNR